MRVALDLNPLTIHKGRGIGFYTQRLEKSLSHLAKSKKDFQLIPFKNKLPSTDLVHLPGFSPFFLNFKMLKKLPIIVTVHDLIPIKYPKHFPKGTRGNIKWQIQKRLLPKTAAILTDSEASKKDIIKMTKINAEKIKVIYLAPDKVFTTLNNQSRLKAIQKRYQLPDKFVLYVGDLNWNKNIIFLTKTCLKLNLPLVVVGKKALEDNYDKTHPENQDLRVFQSLALNHPNQILRLGFVPTKDLSYIYNLATIYAQPSIAEGFGLPILESFACGCPVITSKFTSTEEIAGSAALLINPKSPTDLPKALKKLMSSPALRQKLSLLGLKQVKLFSWEKTARLTYEIYQKVYQNSQK